MKRRSFLKSLIAAAALAMTGFATEIPPKHAEEPPWVEELWNQMMDFTVLLGQDGIYVPEISGGPQ